MLRVLLSVIAILFVIVVVEFVGWKLTKAEFKAYQAQAMQDYVEIRAATNARISLNERINTEILNGVQLNLHKLSLKYLKLRSQTAGSGTVPTLSAASRSLTACPGGGDTAARLLDQVEAGVLGILESGDTEIIKYQQLWQLDRLQQ